MPRQFIKRLTPNYETIRNHKHLRMFGSLLHDPNLWHLNRHSAAGAFAVGLFMAWVPVPVEMLLAAGVAIICRVNLPLSVALVWITNPITIPAMFYFAYLVGTAVVGQPSVEFTFAMSSGEMMESLGDIWEPFLLGCLICAVVSSVTGYFGVLALWRWHLVQHLKKRRKRRHQATGA